MGLPRNTLLIHKRRWKGERHLGVYFKFISAIKCNYIHTADIFVLVKLSLAQEVVEDVVLVVHTSAACSAGAAGGKDCHCQARDIFIIFIIHTFVMEEALHRRKVFLWGWWTGVNEQCRNGTGLLALTLRNSHTGTLQG